MKKCLYIFMSISVISSLCMFINIVIMPFPDWVVRTTGIVVLISLGAIAFISGRLIIARKNK